MAVRLSIPDQTYASQPVSRSVYNPTDLTVCMWFRVPDNGVSRSTFNRLLEHGRFLQGQSGVGLLFRRVTNPSTADTVQPVVYPTNQGFEWYGQGPFDNGSMFAREFTLDTWHHAAWASTVGDTDSLNWWFDGVFIPSGTNGGNAISRESGNANQFLGRENGADQQYGDFLGAEVAYYNKILSTAEVAALARGANPRTVAAPSLIIYLPLLQGGALNDDLEDRMHHNMEDNDLIVQSSPGILTTSLQPPVNRGGRPIVIPPTTAAGGTTFQETATADIGGDSTATEDAIFAESATADIGGDPASSEAGIFAESSTADIGGDPVATEAGTFPESATADVGGDPSISAGMNFVESATADIGGDSAATEAGIFPESSTADIGGDPAASEVGTFSESATADIGGDPSVSSGMTNVKSVTADIGGDSAASETAIFPESATADIGGDPESSESGTFAESATADLGGDPQATSQISGVFTAQVDADIGGEPATTEAGTFPESATADIGGDPQVIDAYTFPEAVEADLGQDPAVQESPVLSESVTADLGGEPTVDELLNILVVADLGGDPAATETAIFVHSVEAEAGLLLDLGPFSGSSVEAEVFAVVVVDIWNIAAAELGIPPVQSQEEQTPQARVFDSVWKTFRRKFLDDHWWNGAKSTKKLNQLSEKPVARWDFAYMLPPDTIRVLTLNGRENQSANKLWEIEVDQDKEIRTLVTDENEATIEYIADLEDMRTLSSATVFAMGLSFAAHVAARFGKNSTEISTINARATQAMAEAKAVDGQEGSPRRFSQTSLLDARQ